MRFLKNKFTTPHRKIIKLSFRFETKSSTSNAATIKLSVATHIQLIRIAMNSTKRALFLPYVNEAALKLNSEFLFRALFEWYAQPVDSRILRLTLLHHSRRHCIGIHICDVLCVSVSLLLSSCFSFMHTHTYWATVLAHPLNISMYESIQFCERANTECRRVFTLR